MVVVVLAVWALVAAHCAEMGHFVSPVGWFWQQCAGIESAGSFHTVFQNEGVVLLICFPIGDIVSILDVNIRFP